MHQNYFDIVMAHIEENVTKTTEEIKLAIPSLIGRHSRAFNECFSILTGFTLDYYIKQRRLSFAVRDLVRCKEKTICDIALEYRFSDQSAFSRAVKANYSVTPSEIRNNEFWLYEKPFCFDDFLEKNSGALVDKLTRRLSIGGTPIQAEIDFMMDISQIREDYGFDLDTCYQIADLGEKLGIPFVYFVECCFLAMAESKRDPEFGLYECPPEVDFMSDMGIESPDEMIAMCEYFKCEYYELDDLKIYTYRKRMKQQSNADVED